MTSWHSYPSIYSLGHAAVQDLLTVPCIVEEKIDGSLFSFGRFDGELRVRSKGVEMRTDSPEKMFRQAVATALMLPLHDGWTYRAEYLSKPHHNTLTYERVPRHNLILFDINDAEESYLLLAAKAREAARIGLECVPVLSTSVSNAGTLQALLQTPSVLGGTTVEGVVVKPAAYNLFGRDKKVLMGKYVSEAFKEAHKLAWKTTNPQQGDILDTLGTAYRTEARWRKAVQHLRDAGLLEESPRDINPLMHEVPADIKQESEEAIKTALFRWAWPHIARASTRGLPEWYKTHLATKTV